MVEPLALLLMLGAGLATVLGAVPLAFLRPLGHRAHDTILGFAAGIMLAVVALDLVPESLDHTGGDAVPIALGIAAGALTIFVLVRAIRRVPLPMPFVKNHPALEPGAAFLIFVALAIHNAPEGLATGLGYAGGITAEGHGIALTIAAQNVPEGLLVALAVFAETRSRGAALGYCFLSGLVEPSAGVAALVFLAVTPEALGSAFAFAAGAMLCVVLVQMVPESHRHGYHRVATVALAGGIVLALGLDIGLRAALG